MVLFNEMYASELIGIQAVDRLQENIGKVKDIIVDLSERFPEVVGVLVETNAKKKEKKVVLIGEIDLIGKQFIALKVTKDRIAWASLRDTDVLLMRDIVDQQIVDLNGARIIRVNDLKLAKVDQDIRLMSVDVGFSGLLRRLGIIKIINLLLRLFKKEVPEQLIGWDKVQNLSKGNVYVPSRTLAELHPADVAQIISQARTDDKNALFSSLTDKTASEALHELEPMLAAVLIANLDTKKALGILEKMPVDEVADILGDLPQEKSAELLRLMRVRKADQVQTLLKHKDETAGGLMTTEFITFTQDLTVEQVIQKLREIAPSAETIYYLYIVNQEEKLVGVLSLRSLIVSSPEKIVSEIMIKGPIAISPEMNQREVANIISKYNLLAVPVVDPQNKIVGIITVDDVIDFILPPFSRRKRNMLG